MSRAIDSGSQVTHCNLPIRLDTYNGCSHRCTYCFATRKIDRAPTPLRDALGALRRFIAGGRVKETIWADWDIPLHWGGMSDGFQPVERQHRVSLKALRILAESRYPVVISTKGALIAEAEYTEALSGCNAVVQISLVSPRYDAIERGAPTHSQRLAMLPVLSRVARRVIVRVQPYCVGLMKDVVACLPAFAGAGVYGLTIEGLKTSKKKPGMIKAGGDFCYPVDALRADFSALRSACDRHGLVFLCAENRLRNMGQSMNCCGTDGLEGFDDNRSNLNHISENGDIAYRETMLRPGSGAVFKGLVQKTLTTRAVTRSSYRDVMEIAKRTTSIRTALGNKNGRR